LSRCERSQMHCARLQDSLGVCCPYGAARSCDPCSCCQTRRGRGRPCDIESREHLIQQRRFVTASGSVKRILEAVKSEVTSVEVHASRKLSAKCADVPTIQGDLRSQVARQREREVLDVGTYEVRVERIYQPRPVRHWNYCRSRRREECRLNR